MVAKLENNVITQNDTLTIVFVGNHVPGRSNIDVTGAFFRHHPPLPFFVTELFTTFPNLQQLHLLQGTYLNIQSGSFGNVQNLQIA